MGINWSKNEISRNMGLFAEKKGQKNTKAEKPIVAQKRRVKSKPAKSLSEAIKDKELEDFYLMKMTNLEETKVKVSFWIPKEIDDKLKFITSKTNNKLQKSIMFRLGVYKEIKTLFSEFPELLSEFEKTHKNRPKKP